MDPSGRRALPGRAPVRRGPTAPSPPFFAYFFVPKPRGYVAKSQPPLGAENTREKRALRRAEIRGNSLRRKSTPSSPSSSWTSSPSPSSSSSSSSPPSPPLHLVTAVTIWVYVQIVIHHHITSDHVPYDVSTNGECPALRSFLQKRGLVFCTVDKREDFHKLYFEKIIIPRENWIDIQEFVHVKGLNDRGYLMRDGMASLATSIIDESYSQMKNKFPPERHDYWEERPLSDLNLEYAAKDAYVSYQLYVKIWFFLRYLVFCPGCKKEDTLRGHLCDKCNAAEIEAERAQKNAAAEIARLKAELASVQAELASLKAPASSDNTQQTSPPHGMSSGWRVVMRRRVVIIGRT
ncbi:hypothetical protein QYE76_055601 [Lolium multiflorum]|uniref:3'-5' exonuclease domain-containing protein n=1 Tax=Lolium multiflorum TaxID=4521 RepID=A0AAD8T0P1_LOLMU|nr:hypothetical protein QYE76_055601 [Lolium multiflorum]